MSIIKIICEINLIYYFNLIRNMYILQLKKDCISYFTCSHNVELGATYRNNDLRLHARIVELNKPGAL